ncbi:MAG TPA: restriction endonuclease subunit S [Bacteroidales bacterium]|nr:restriction endonuclease subunit S [Bacteroidales bacterium]
MEVKAGYKQTEVGVIPSDWEVHNLLRNSILKARIGWQGLTTAEYLTIGDYFLVTGTDFSNGKINWETCFYVSKYRYSQDKYIQLHESDILITKDGTIGKIAFIDKLPRLATLNSGVFVIRPKENAYLPLFFFYVLNSIFFHNFLNKLVAGSTINHLYQKDFNSFNFPLPSAVSEQAAIATALLDTDAFISSLEKLIVKKKMIKQGAMQELLKPKKGWEVKKLGECLLKNPDYGINAAAVDFDDTLPTYLRITDISDNGKYLHANKVSVNNVNSDSYYLDEGDIVFARTGASVGKTYLYDKNDGKLVFAGFLIRLRSNPKILFYKYLFYITQTKAYWSWVLANSMRSGQPGINSNEYKSYEISLPNLTEQKRIANILADMDSEINALETKLEKYKMIKLGMMQELLTGRIRLI